MSFWIGVKLITISILPTRHGNCDASRILGKCDGFRSYLRGMETKIDQPWIWWGSLPNFDPTYEAWKLICGLYGKCQENYFDPTYEAWKHPFVS